MTAADVLDFIQKGGVVSLFILFTWAIMTGRLVAGYLYKDALRERDEWKSAALNGIHAASTATDELVKERGSRK